MKGKRYEKNNQERRIVTRSQRKQEEVEQQGEKMTKWDPFLDEVIMFNVFIWLPAQILHRLKLVCKVWFKIICDPYFINVHFLQSKPTFMIHAQASIDPKIYKTYLMEVQEETVMIHDLNFQCMKPILSSCNGLVLLLEPPTKVPCIINPVTRERMSLPPRYRKRRGRPNLNFKGDYELAFVPSTGEYKVIYLCKEVYSVSCDILTVGGSKKWRHVEALKHFSTGFYDYNHVAINGILHLKGYFAIFDGSANKYLVSMDLATENFHTTLLPDNDICATHWIEMGGLLGLVTQKHEYSTQITIWVLKEFSSGNWVRRCKLLIDDLRFGVCPSKFFFYGSLKNGKLLIFRMEKKGHTRYYAYDMELKQVKLIEFNMQEDFKWLKHVSSLISWKTTPSRVHL